MALLGMLESCSIISSFEGIFLWGEEVYSRDITSIKKEKKTKKERKKEKALIAPCLMDSVVK